LNQYSKRCKVGKSPPVIDLTLEESTHFILRGDTDIFNNSSTIPSWPILCEIQRQFANADGKLFLKYAEVGHSVTKITLASNNVLQNFEVVPDALSIGDLISYEHQIGRVAAVRVHDVDIAFLDGRVSHQS
jgi:hypothetical protein